MGKRQTRFTRVWFWREGQSMTFTTPKQLGKVWGFPFAVLQMAAIVFMIASPVLWIFASWSTAWRVGLTGFVGSLVVQILAHAARILFGKEPEAEK